MAKSLRYLTPYEAAIELNLIYKEVKQMKRGGGREYTKELNKALKGISVAVRQLDRVSKKHYHV